MTLIEVLVAILVTSVGVLGVSGLQIASLQTNRAALLRTEAVLMAQDMMERMRANVSATGGVRHYDGLGLGDPPPNPPNCGALDCTPGEMADFDRAAWKCRLGGFRDQPACVTLAGVAGSGFVAGASPEAALPQGDGAIEVGGQGRSVNVMVRWREGGQTQSVSVAGRI